MEEEGRRKKEEGRRKKEGRGLYMWIQDPNSKLNEGRRKKEEGRRKEEVYICGYRTPTQKGFPVDVGVLNSAPG
jgi:hypothetical protein